MLRCGLLHCFFIDKLFAILGIQTLKTTMIFLFFLDLFQECEVCYKVLGSVLWSTLNVAWTTFWSVFCMTANSAGKHRVLQDP